MGPSREMERANQLKRDLQKRIEGHSGEQILLVYDEGKDDSDDPFGFSIPDLETTEVLGILNKNLSIANRGVTQDDSNAIYLETVGYIHRGNKSFGQKITETNFFERTEVWEVREGSILLDHIFAEFYGSSVYKRIGDGCWGRGTFVAKGAGLHIAVGNRAVEFYFQGYLQRTLVQDQFWPRLEEIEKEKNLGRDRDPEEFDLSYIDALRLLGREAPESFLNERRRRDEEEQKAIIQSLEASLSERERINERGTSRPSLSRTKFFSFEDREKIRGLDERVSKSLKRAVSLGMHQTPRREPLERQGKYIDVPEYISSLCKTYSPFLLPQK